MDATDIQHQNFPLLTHIFTFENIDPIRNFSMYHQV